MKKSIIFAAFAAVLFSFSFSSCDNDTPVDEIQTNEEEAYAFDGVKFGMNVSQVNAVKYDDIQYDGGDSYKGDCSYTIGRYVINSDGKAQGYEWDNPMFHIDPNYGLYMMSLGEYVSIAQCPYFLDEIIEELNIENKGKHVILKDPHTFSIPYYHDGMDLNQTVVGAWSVGSKATYLLATKLNDRVVMVQVATIDEKISAKINGKSHSAKRNVMRSCEDWSFENIENAER